MGFKCGGGRGDSRERFRGNQLRLVVGNPTIYDKFQKHPSCWRDFWSINSRSLLFLAMWMIYFATGDRLPQVILLISGGMLGCSEIHRSQEKRRVSSKVSFWVKVHHFSLVGDEQKRPCFGMFCKCIKWGKIYPMCLGSRIQQGFPTKINSNQSLLRTNERISSKFSWIKSGECLCDLLKNYHFRGIHYPPIEIFLVP